MEWSVILSIIVVFGGFLLCDYLIPKWRKEGLFLKSEIKPYYNKILFYLENYINTDFGKNLNEKAISLLEYIYKRNKTLVNPENDDIYKHIIDNRDNNNYVYSFAWLFLHSHMGEVTNKESIEFPLAQKIRRIVYEEEKELPQELLDFFEIRLH